MVLYKHAHTCDVLKCVVHTCARCVCVCVQTCVRRCVGVWLPCGSHPPRGLLGAARGRLGDVLGYTLGYVPRGRCENVGFLQL